MIINKPGRIPAYVLDQHKLIFALVRKKELDTHLTDLIFVLFDHVNMAFLILEDGFH